MSSFSIGQMNQLGDALERAGFTAGDVTTLGQFAGLSEVRGVLSGTHRIVEVEKPTAAFVVDTTNASMPQAWRDAKWEVEEHKSLGTVTVRFADGEMYINDRKVGECLTGKQKAGPVAGTQLRKELADKPTLPDAILDLLIKEQDNQAVQRFLQKYRGRYPFFWSTIYRDPSGRLFVRYLDGDGKRFDWHGHWFGLGWGALSPALVLAPPSESGT